MTTFAEKFCSDHKLEAEQYRTEVFVRVLYPGTARVQSLLKWIPGYFEADYEFIDGVGRITSLKGFDGEEGDFSRHAKNRGFMRRTLKLRVSGRRLKSLVYATLGPDKH